MIINWREAESKELYGPIIDHGGRLEAEEVKAKCTDLGKQFMWGNNISTTV